MAMEEQKGKLNDSPADKVKKAKEIHKQKCTLPHEQLKVGCGREFCLNPNCYSNPYSNRATTPAEIEGRKIQLMQKNEFELCSTKGLPPHSINIEALRLLATAMTPPKNIFAKMFEGVFANKKEQELQLKLLHKCFSNSISLAISFRKHILIHSDFLTKSHDLDYASLDLLEKLCNDYELVRQFALDGLQELFKTQWKDNIDSIGYIETLLNIRKLFIILEIQPIFEPKNSNLLNELLNKTIKIKQDTLNLYSQWLTDYPKERFQRLIKNLQLTITCLLKAEALSVDSLLFKVCNFLGLLYNINKKLRKVHYNEFYNLIANTDKLLKKREIRKWCSNKRKGTHFFTIYDFPWMLDPESKYLMLSIDSDLEQVVASMNMPNGDLLLNYMLHGSGVLPYCLIEVRRDNLILDTLNLLSNKNINFRKQLKVKFAGEVGEDTGGLKKEFFQLIIRQVFDPQYTMFTYNSETRTYWFNPDTLELRIKFELIGFILGLALYNSVILDVHFPKVLYKKLLGLSPSFEDLMDFSPSIGQSLEFIQKYDKDDLQDVLSCYFAIETESYGKISTVELVPGGSNLAVTQKNKKEYVQLYIEWLFDNSVKDLFEAFKRGFYKLYCGEFTTNCDPEELELMICGSPVFDFYQLEKATHYEGGYDKDSPTIINFWKVIHELDLEQKKKFLFFTTGSDRAPVGGLGSMDFHIMKHGEDGAQLPSAHTCFNHLLLPPYQDIGKLKEKLLIAISNSEGFGLF